MGFTAPIVKRLTLPKIWREMILHQQLGRKAILGLYDIQPPWPDILIGTGRVSIVASLYVKKASGGRTFTVQIQTPVGSLDRFDCVVVPEHDKAQGKNVITMTGALHRVTPHLLSASADLWRPRFAQLPRPYVGVLLGGTGTPYRFGEREMANIGAMLATLARDEKVSLLITVSRRTSRATIALLRDLLRDSPAVIWDGVGENPYYGILGLGDAFIVTCDSVNMICEACSTGKPVHMIQLPGHWPKLTAFHKNLLDTSRVRIFDGTLGQWTYEPLAEKSRVAALVRSAYEDSRARIG